MEIAIAYRTRSKLKEEEERKRKEEEERKQQEAKIQWRKLDDRMIQDVIFMKLPGNSILLSRCVCKQFRHLILDPDFIKNHVNLSIQKKNNPKLLFTHFVSYYEPPTIHSLPIDHDSIISSLPQGCLGSVRLNYPFQSDDQRCDHRFLGSCNGLVWLNICRVSRDDLKRRYEGTNYFTILNPLTREFKEFTMQTVRKFAFGSAYGFGYDGTNDDYKVVAISDNKTTGFSDFEVYTVKSNLLTSIPGTVKYSFHGVNKLGSRGLYFHGRLHWLGRIVVTQENPSSQAILCYDMSNGNGIMMVNMPLPQDVSNLADSEDYRNVEVCGDRICVVLIREYVRVDVWVMQEYGVDESWVRKYTAIQLQPLRKLECWRPLWWFENGEVLVDCGFRQSLELFDPTTGAVRSVFVHDITMDGRRESYVESIASLNSGTYL